MKKIPINKKLFALGIISYLLTIISSVESLEGVYVMPPLLILVAAVIQIVFIIVAEIYLWKKHKTALIIFLIFSLTSLVYLNPIIKIGHLITFIWIMVLLWKTKKEDKLHEK